MTVRMTTNPSNDVFKPFTTADQVKDNSAEVPQDLEEFDPFQIGASAAGKGKGGKSPRESPDRKGASGVFGRASNALPPRLDVKFKVHEEVSSTADTSAENEGSSDVYVEGTVQAQVTSSDALKNSPFILVASNPFGSELTFNANTTYVKSYSSQGSTAQVNVIKIPKSMVGFVTAGKYELTEKVIHMPMLLERKITRSKAKVQVAIQVRSKLSNPDDMKSMSIALSMPDKIAGDTVEINAGNGEWDRVTRTIIWNLHRLPKGESFMVSARAKLREGNEDIETSELQFPVVMRCESNDQISSAGFQAIEASGYPATVSSSTAQTSFRIVHRLP